VPEITEWYIKLGILWQGTTNPGYRSTHLLDKLAWHPDFGKHVLCDFIRVQPKLDR